MKRYVLASTLGVFGVGALVYTQYLWKWRRPLRTMWMGMKMYGIYRWSEQSETECHSKASKVLRDLLEKNNGIYIKFGQLIAMLDTVVPKEYRDTMLSLTCQCQADSFEQVKLTIEEELHRPYDQFFAEFDSVPISSASIGQVHRAKLRTGEIVAVKIQHRNLKKYIQNDLLLMNAFVKAAKYFFPSFNYEWLVEEFSKNIRKELNFIHQSQNAANMKRILQNSTLEGVYIPQLYLQPTQRLLIMEYITAVKMHQIDKMKALNIDLKKMGKLFSQLVVKMIHEFGFVHADIHTGNLLVRKHEGKDQLVLIDHGLYQTITSELQQEYNKFWLGLITNDKIMFSEAANCLGVSNPNLLQCMMLSKTQEDIIAPDRNIFDLNPSLTEKVKSQAIRQHENIVKVLGEIDRDVLLLLKVNEYARSVQNTLGGRQMGVYHDIALTCLARSEGNFLQKFKTVFQMWLNKP